MNYHPDDFLALSQAVVDDGGECFADPCVGSTVRYRVPGAGGKKVWVRRQTTHCDMSARMGIKYDPALHIRIEGEPAPGLLGEVTKPATIVDHPGEKVYRDRKVPLAVVCAVDDCVGLWPRYNEIVSDRSYQS